MIGVDMKALLEKCNGYTTQALHAAAGLTVNRTHYEVTVEHLLLACLEDQGADIPLALTRFGADIGRLKAAVNDSMEDFRAGNSSRPVFSPLLMELLEAAWLVASVDLGLTRIRSGAILLAFLRKPALYAQGGYTDLIGQVNREELQKNFWDLAKVSTESAGEGPAAKPTGEAARTPGGTGESFIAKFCEDFTAKAKAGKIDAVFGRDPEIRQIVDILARRRKNNPILVGEPGVGKTAVIEGLALRITQGDVPEVLEGVTLLGLDMGLLEAGAGMKGEFERRLKGVLDEIKSSEKPIVLFIDEAHTLVGAGGTAGGSDAANLLKPALARGEIKTCAATTWKEYKKYFEKDPALARRFQLVKLDEPSVLTAALILRGIRDAYEAAHKVVIRDDAIECAAEFSHRYITGRFLPDKAIDLLDTACARVKVSLSSKPGELEDKERAIQAAQREKKALERDLANGAPVDLDRIQELEGKITDLTAQAEDVRAAWQKELEAARLLIDARTALNAGMAEQSDKAGAPDALDSSDTSHTSHASHVTDIPTTSDQEALRTALADARTAYDAVRVGDGLVSIEVTSDVVAKVVSDWTGIPVGKVAREQAAVAVDLERRLGERIKGQDAALRAVAEAVKAAKAGLRGPEQPSGVFLLVGPSGVGKTETGLALADILFGDERSVVTINMSEFQEKHTVSRLIGSPPGYVGYGEGGMLSEAVRQRPYSVVLLDEVEKAHLDVMNLFYQVFDKGLLTDGEGKEISFRNTVIMLTSNLGADVIQEMTKDGAELDLDTVLSAVRPILSEHFKPALLARMSIVPYQSLSGEAMRRIARLKLDALARRLLLNNKMTMTYADTVPDQIAARCTEVETGARNIEYILSGTILPRMSQEILSHMSDAGMPRSVALDVGEDGGFTMTFGHDDGQAKPAGRKSKGKGKKA
ncbi:type VI secretion system ATPase TssH [Desulfonatronum sp. SC1]|uniref:type VI secretion system ATPase TssH n=1 Tax=Desulfonatronum sp. SC1 TaxID=2109626 RepID=UPI000D2F7E1B|nr:type VI secretion system ATPase TssH [Desulfonatronum sp. SC1]PTN35977.1 type VI secretion system ATPase TssH [Desulfonatronum sp. SC1]